MRMVSRLLAGLLALAAVLPQPAAAQATPPSADQAVFLIAAPAFRDPEYRQSVLIASPTASGGHIGVILNSRRGAPCRACSPSTSPRRRSIEPVFFGGPFSTSALVAVVRGDKSPGAGSLLMMANLYLAINVNTIDRIIEERPNDARYYVGYVGWRPGELRREIDRGLWHVMNPDVNTIFRKDTDQPLGRDAADGPPDQRRRAGATRASGARPKDAALRAAALLAASLALGGLRRRRRRFPSTASSWSPSRPPRPELPAAPSCSSRNAPDGGTSASS